jgi:hypothetical protein
MVLIATALLRWYPITPAFKLVVKGDQSTSSTGLISLN